MRSAWGMTSIWKSATPCAPHAVGRIARRRFFGSRPGKIYRADYRPRSLPLSKINVADSLLHRNSLLHRIIDIANTRSEFPEIAVAPFRLLTIDSDAVLGIYYETEERSILTFVNFSDQPVQFTVKDPQHDLDRLSRGQTLR